MTKKLSGDSAFPSSKPKSGFLKKLVIVVSVVSVTVIAFGVGVQLVDKSFEACLVNDKKVTDEGKMFVYTENCGDMTVNLNPLIGERSSKTVFEKLVPGDVYDMKLHGIQFDALNILPNLMDAQYRFTDVKDPVE